jgi:hypothetical protein
MTNATTTRTELLALEIQVLDAAQDLTKALEALSDFHWGNETINPIFRPERGTLDVLDQVDAMIAAPSSEIRGAA